MSDAEAPSASSVPRDALERRLDALSKRLEGAESEIETLRQTTDQLEAENERLRERLESVQQRTDLLDDIQEAASLAPEQRAAILIQTLYNEAIERDGSAAMDVNAARKALGGSIDRAGIYYTFNTAADIVDGSVVEYRKQPRSADQNSRLVLDLEAGTVPDTVAGQRISGGEER